MKCVLYIVGKQMRLKQMPRDDANSVKPYAPKIDNNSNKNTKI